MTIITATRLTDAAREKALVSTGTDPGEYVYRLHRDGCDRAKDNPRDVGRDLTVTPAQVLDAKVCTRCQARGTDVDALKADAQAALDQQVQTAERVLSSAAQTEVTASQSVRRTRAVPEYQGTEQFPVYAGPAAPSNSDGVLGLTPSVYPEVLDHVRLWCSAHREEHIAREFAFVTKKGDGRGRMVECRRAQVDRLAQNVERKARGEQKVPAPRLPYERVVTSAPNRT